MIWPADNLIIPEIACAVYHRGAGGIARLIAHCLCRLHAGVDLTDESVDHASSPPP